MIGVVGLDPRVKPEDDEIVGLEDDGVVGFEDGGVSRSVILGLDPGI